MFEDDLMITGGFYPCLSLLKKTIKRSAVIGSLPRELTDLIKLERLILSPYLQPTQSPDLTGLLKIASPLLKHFFPQSVTTLIDEPNKSSKQISC